MFRTHQERLVRELALAGITDMSEANRYLQDHYRAAFNAEFAQPAMEDGSAFVGWIGGPLENILCERFERTVVNDNFVSFGTMKLQIPAGRYRCHYVKAQVAVLRRTDGTLAVLHGPRTLASTPPKVNRGGSIVAGSRAIDDSSGAGLRFRPGGRMLAEFMSKDLKQAVVVSNKPGANGIIASQMVQGEPADGGRIALAAVAGTAPAEGTDA